MRTWLSAGYKHDKGTGRLVKTVADSKRRRSTARSEAGGAAGVEPAWPAAALPQRVALVQSGGERLTDGAGAASQVPVPEQAPGPLLVAGPELPVGGAMAVAAAAEVVGLEPRVRGLPVVATPGLKIGWRPRPRATSPPQWRQRMRFMRPLALPPLEIRCGFTVPKPSPFGAKRLEPRTGSSVRALVTAKKAPATRSTVSRAAGARRAVRWGPRRTATLELASTCDQRGWYQSVASSQP
jgi:hypothetical protein